MLLFVLSVVLWWPTAERLFVVAAIAVAMELHRRWKRSRRREQLVQEFLLRLRLDPGGVEAID